MLYDNKKVSKFCLAQIPINQNGTRFNFPDQPQLRGKRVQYVTAYFNNLYPLNPDGIALVQSSAILEGFLILYVNGRDDIKMPLYHLVTQSNAMSQSYFTNNGYLPIANLPIVWEKSYVLVPNGYSLTALQEVFMFGVFYADK